jgi:hypothetical protein
MDQIQIQIPFSAAPLVNTDGAAAPSAAGVALSALFRAWCNPTAKIYGKRRSGRIVVEGCSRTDRGVHARSMIAQIYRLV